jgi:hypothetical protein
MVTNLLKPQLVCNNLSITNVECLAQSKIGSYLFKRKLCKRSQMRWFVPGPPVDPRVSLLVGHVVPIRVQYGIGLRVDVQRRVSLHCEVRAQKYEEDDEDA